MTRSKWNWMVVLFLFAVCTLVTVPAIAQQHVQVINGDGAPVPTLEATQPYEDSCIIYFEGDSGSCNFKTVPPHKRLVVQEFDNYLNVEPGLQPDYVALATLISHAFTATLMSYNSYAYTYATHQETRLYVSGGTTPICGIELTQSSYLGVDQCDISGFLVDVP